MKKIIFGILIVCILINTAIAQVKQGSILIRNADIFDGKNKEVKKGHSILIEGNTIKLIGANINPPDNTQIIDAKGAMLIPGIVGAHEHLMLQVSSFDFVAADSRYLAYVATRTAKQYLMNGWTSVRDASGNTFSLKGAIDNNVIVGPRIFPSGAMISQTSGHSDGRLPSNPSSFSGGRPSNLQLFGDLVIADGESEVLKAAREQLRMGATQIKIAVGGGTASAADPLDVVQYTNAEIRAAVQAAADYNTYVLAHVYNSKGIKRAIANGVKSIEHANMIDKETLQLMKDKNVWLSAQVMGFTPTNTDGLTQEQIKKLNQANNKLDSMFKLLKKHKFNRIGFGTDIINSPDLIKRINEEFTQRTQWFSNFEIMKQATYNSGQILNMSHRNSPGKIGVIEEGALADILLVNGNLLEDISIITKPDKNLLLIMKDGKVYKNIL